MRKFLTLVSALTLPLAVTACSTSGGSDIPSPIAFTSFQDMKAGQTTKIAGYGTEQSVSRAGGVATPGSITENAKITADVTLDAEGRIDSVKIDGPKTVSEWKNISAGLQPGESPTEDIVVAHTDGRNHSLYMAAPGVRGYEYQTFGAWATNRNADSGTIGAFSVGSETASSVLNEQSGTAYFRGDAVGTYISPEGKEYMATSQAHLNADFAGKTIDFETSHTSVTAVGSSTSTLAPGLDLEGTLSWGSRNAFSGTVNSGNGLVGNASGRFYGPGTEEVGGTFALKAPAALVTSPFEGGGESTGSGMGTYVGAFGARAQ